MGKIYENILIIGALTHDHKDRILFIVHSVKYFCLKTAAKVKLMHKTRIHKVVTVYRIPIAHYHLRNL